MYSDHFYTNLSNSVVSALQAQEEIISKFSESFMPALQIQAETFLKFSASVTSALQTQDNLVQKFPLSVVSALQIQAEFASKALNAVPISTMDYFRSLTSNYEQLHTIDFANEMATACNSICNAIKFPSDLQGRFDFLKNLNLQEAFIELSDDDYDSINTFLKTSNTSANVPKKVSNGKMAMDDFIKSVLIPILAIALPMLLTIYYHKVDSIESQKQYIEELQLKEKELQLKEEEICIKEQQLQNDIAEKEILENILIELQNQSKCCIAPESPVEASSYSGETPEPPGEAPEPFGEALNYSGVIADEPDNP